MSILGSPYLLAGAVVIAFGSGWQVHTWKVKANTEKAVVEALETANAEIEKQKGYAQDEIDRADRLSIDLRETRQALGEQMMANATLAASRASTTTRIIEKGEEIGNQLQSDYPCIREPWPDGLLDYFNGDSGKSGVSTPSALAGGTSASGLLSESPGY